MFFVGGSRSLPPGAVAWCGAVVRGLLSRGLVVSVGCASGADAAFLAGVPSWGWSRVRVAAVFAASGAGAGRWSAVSAVCRAASLGASVAWCAGGPPSVSLRSRLVRRSRFAALGCSAGLVVLSSPSSRGSLASAFRLARAGRRVFVVCWGFPSAGLSLPAGFSLSPVRPVSPLPSGSACFRLSWSGPRSSLLPPSFRPRPFAG